MIEENSLSADNPLEDPSKDALGYVPFAKNLANALIKMVPTDGLVVAVHGQWGSGKSTMLNFTLHYLNESDELKSPVIFRFYPWWFSDQEDLVRNFFGQFQACLKGKDFEDIRKKLADFTGIVSKLPLIPGIEALGGVESWLRKDKDLSKLKTEISSLLRKQDKKIIVLIDDIDRLSANEIKQLFRTIKAIANFPNVIYLLAFDKEIVAQALEDEQYISGHDFLEKIVQVPFELPPPSKIDLRRMTFAGLDEILSQAGVDDDEVDLEYWANVYMRGIDGFIRTPRNIVRLMNVLRVTYPAVHGEVNVVDFIAIEALRIFCPVAYAMARKMPNEFAGAVSESQTRGILENEGSIHDTWLEQLPDEKRESAKQLLKSIFPKFAYDYGGSIWGGEWESNWRKSRLIRSPEIFPIYFRLAVPEGEISNTEMQVYLSSMSDSEKFGQVLLELVSALRPDGTTRVSEFLERLEDYTQKEIPIEHIPNVLKTFFDVGRQLLRDEDEPKGMSFYLGNWMRISRVMYQLGQRLDKETRFGLLKNLSQNGNSLDIVVHEISLIGDEHKKVGDKEPSPESERAVSPTQLKELEKIGLKRIRAAAKDGSLIHARKLRYILYRWKEWTNDPKEIRDWAEVIAANDRHLATFIETFGNIRKSQTLGSYFTRKALRVKPEWIADFVDPDKIIDRSRTLMDDQSLSENQRTAIKRFVYEYDLLKEGKDPEDDWM